MGWNILAFGAVTAVALMCGPSVGLAAEPPALDNTAWVLVSLPGEGAIVDAPPTAQFEGGRVFGSDGCNRYSAPYTGAPPSLEIGPRAASTLKACPEPVMKQAQAFIGALVAAKTYRVMEGRLELISAEGAIVASFKAQSQSLAGTSWRAVGINNGKGGVASVVEGSTVTLEFSPDGKVSGSAGCNRYTSSFTADGGKLTIAPPGATQKMCAAAGVMEQEQAFFNALQTVASVRIEGDGLEMRTGEGALAITCVRTDGR